MDSELGTLVFYLSIFVATGVASPLLISLLQSSGACESTTLLFVVPNYVGMALSVFFQPKNEGLMGYVEVAGGDSIKVGCESTPKSSTPSSSPPPSPSRAAVAQEKKTKAIPHLLIVFLCIIDAISAGLNLTGLVFCGSGVYTVVYSSVTMWTAIFSWIILGRKLQALQWLGIWIIVVGLSLTSVFAPSTIGPVVNVGSGPDDGESVVVDDGGSGGGGGGGGGESVLTFSLTFSPPSSASPSNLVSDSSRMSLGIVLVVCGSLLHSLSYIISEIILTTFQASGITPFRLSSMMGMFGLAVFGFWQVIYTLPRFQVLVVDEIHRHGGVLWVIALSYALLVACSLIHAISFFSLIKRVGSTTTGVLKGLQSVLTFVLSHYFFCAIQASQCFSNTKGISLGLVLLGVFFYSYFEVPEDVNRADDVETGGHRRSGSGSLQTLAIEMGLRPKPNFSFYQLAYVEAEPGEPPRLGE